MEESENKRISIIVDDGTSDENSASADQPSKMAKLKKPLIFCLMGIIFIACLYLIFKPKDSEEELKDAGLKHAVPEATDKGLQADKQKAYEKEMVDEREAAKRNSMMSLSDYWNSGSDSIGTGQVAAAESAPGATSGNFGHSGYPNNSLASYQQAQHTLSSFYQDDDREKLALRRQVDQLKEKISEKDVPAAPTLQDQLTLMEKSYEMASKYLPSGTPTSAVTPVFSPKDSADNKNPVSQPKSGEAENLKGVRKTVVSALYREPDDSSFLSALEGDRNRVFLTPGAQAQAEIVRNSIRAAVMETNTIGPDGTVKLRLLENAMIGGYDVSKGTEMEAHARFQGNRLQLKISSVAVQGHILPVEITVYDLNGQPGLAVPRSDEINAAGEIAANMSQSSGMNISMSRSAGQQVVGDLTRGLVQGVSGYFSKKIRMTKVTLKAGHQVLLVPKKNN